MRLSIQLSDKFFDVIEKSRRVSRLTFSKDEFRNWCYTLNTINGLDKDMHFVGAYLLESYKIPECLSSLVMPCEVTFSSDVWAADFKSKEYAENLITELTDEKGNVVYRPCLLSPEDFSLMGGAIMGAVRKTSDEKEVKDLRVRKTLADLTDRLALEKTDELYLTSTPYIPVYVTMRPYKSFKYNSTIDEVVYEWLREALK